MKPTPLNTPLRISRGALTEVKEPQPPQEVCIDQSYHFWVIFTRVNYSLFCVIFTGMKTIILYVFVICSPNLPYKVTALSPVASHSKIATSPSKSSPMKPAGGTPKKSGGPGSVHPTPSVRAARDSLFSFLYLG